MEEETAATGAGAWAWTVKADGPPKEEEGRPSEEGMEPIVDEGATPPIEAIELPTTASELLLGWLLLADIEEAMLLIGVAVPTESEEEGTPTGMLRWIDAETPMEEGTPIEGQGLAEARKGTSAVATTPPTPPPLNSIPVANAN